MRSKNEPTKLAFVSYSMIPMTAIKDAASTNRRNKVSSRSIVSTPSAMSNAIAHDRDDVEDPTVGKTAPDPPGTRRGLRARAT